MAALPLNLGGKLVRVSELMSRSIVTVGTEDSVALAARLMERHGVGALPVCAPGGKLKGMVTDRDIALRCVAADRNPEQTPVGEIMSRHVTTVPPQADVRQATLYMAKAQIRRLPVVEDGRVLGVLSIGDVARTQSYDMEASKALGEISQRETGRF